MQPLPPQDNQVQVQPHVPDQGTISEALQYMEKSKADIDQAGTIGDAAKAMLIQQQTFLQRMKQMDHDHAERMATNLGRIQIQGRIQEVQTQAYLQQQHERIMASLRRSTGKGDLTTQLTEKAISFTFDWLRSRF